MPYQNYSELIVWQKAMDLTDIVYSLAKKLPAQEKFALSDQMRRAVVSIPSNIAEGHNRQSPNEFRNFLSIASGSLAELETQLIICVRQNFFTREDIKSALALTDEIDRMLASLILKLQ